MRARRSITFSLAAAAAALLALGTAAVASGSSIALSGPHLNVYHTPFHYVASGTASAPANYVYGWEAPYTPKCASTYKAEAKRGGLALFTSRSLGHGHFSFIINFYARNTLAHRFCAYVINRASGATLARAETTWRNYQPAGGGGGGGGSTGALQPTPVGEGRCQAKKFPDLSAYAQVAVQGTECGTLEKVAYGADAAKGAAYSAAGYSCSAKAEGAGSTWASAWTGTYYAYTCTAGSAQVAFNWGTAYAYVPASTLPNVTPGG